MIGVSGGYYGGYGEQRESLKLVLNLGHESFMRHEGTIHTVIGDTLTKMQAEDTLRITYTLDLNYHGRVLKRLAAITELLKDPQVEIREGCTFDLERGKSVLLEMVRTFDRAILAAKEKERERV